MASITKLTEYAERIDATPKPTDRFVINLDRATKDWMLRDLGKRADRLIQAVRDPKTKEKKREKKHMEVEHLQAAIEALTTKAKMV